MKKVLSIFILLVFLCGCRKTPKIEVEFYTQQSIQVLGVSISVKDMVNDIKDKKWRKFIKRLYANNYKEYNKTIDILAQLLNGEGGKTTTNQASVAWCVLNRVDKTKGRKTIIQIATAKHQFAWNKRAPIKNHLKKLAKDVLNRWISEKTGKKNVGRVLPKGYCYFGGDGTWNRFRLYYKVGHKGQKRIIPKYSKIYKD